MPLCQYQDVCREHVWVCMSMSVCVRMCRSCECAFLYHRDHVFFSHVSVSSGVCVWGDSCVCLCVTDCG